MNKRIITVAVATLALAACQSEPAETTVTTEEVVEAPATEDPAMMSGEAEADIEAMEELGAESETSEDTMTTTEQRDAELGEVDTQ